MPDLPEVTITPKKRELIKIGNQTFNADADPAVKTRGIAALKRLDSGEMDAARGISASDYASYKGPDPTTQSSDHMNKN